MNYNLVSYAMDFSSFLMQNIKEKDRIKNIILFGSVARGESNKESDIDLFIDIINEDKIEEESNKILKDFYNSTKFKNYWKLFNTKNKIKLTIGKLDEWEDLKNSIISNGLSLYGKYQEIPAKGKNMALFFLENIKPNIKRVTLNKKIFGYKHSGKFYNGMLQKYGGIKLGKGSIIIPLEHSNKFIEIFRKFKISVKIKKVFDYSE